MKKILLIEDESNVVSFIKKGLTEEGFEVSVALDGETGNTMAVAGGYDLIILDIMLPDRNGIDVCRELRKSRILTPVLFLTALNTSDNIALGLNSGGDDYLVKPFKFIELLARINALLRRVNPQVTEVNEKDVYSLAGLVVDDGAKSVQRDGQAISLTATEYRLLLMLISNKGRVLSRVDLLEAVWGIDFNMGTNVVDVYINYLRKKLDQGFELKLIHTVIGMGYVMKEK